MVAPLVIGAAILSIANKLFDIMQTVSFMMFIEEEGIQVRGFGIMSLIREKLVDDVETQLDDMRTHTTNLETFIDSWGWIAPYMKPTYSRYVQATWDQIDAWDAWRVSVSAETPIFGVRIQSSPSGAEIKVDHAETSFLTPHAFYDLEAKAHRFDLAYTSSRYGKMGITNAVVLEEGIIKEVLWNLSSKQGRLKIVSSPSSADIIINGADTSKLTPQTFLLDPGTYKFKLEYDSSKRGLLRYEETITIQKEDDKEFRWILSEV